MATLCERCLARGNKNHALPKCRFCGACRAVVLMEMRKSGYLTFIPPEHHKTYAPCSTEPGPQWDNVVRAYEEALELDKP